MLHWIVLATSWNILSGYSGYFSFGHGAFFGAGVYTTRTLLARQVRRAVPVDAAGRLRWSPRLLACALGAVVFRVRERARRAVRAADAGGHRSCSATIVAQHAARRRTGRLRCRAVPVPQLGADAVGHVLPARARCWRSRRSLIAYGDHACRGSALGLFAIHDDEDAAEVMGVPTYRYKLHRARRSPARSPASPAASTRCSCRT